MEVCACAVCSVEVCACAVCSVEVCACAMCSMDIEEILLLGLNLLTRLLFQLSFYFVSSQLLNSTPKILYETLLGYVCV